jgi:hypothetical protein
MFEALRQGSDHLRLLPVLPAAFQHHLWAYQGSVHQASWQHFRYLDLNHIFIHQQVAPSVVNLCKQTQIL